MFAMRGNKAFFGELLHISVQEWNSIEFIATRYPTRELLPKAHRKYQAMILVRICMDLIIYTLSVIVERYIFTDSW